MAGIGFELKKLLKKDSYVSVFAGYFYGSLISSGPWIMTVLCLFGLNYFSQFWLNPSEQLLFQGTVTYTFIFSLIVTGALQMAVARHISDCLYREEFDQILPSFVSTCLLVLFVQGVLGGAVLLFSQQSWLFKVLSFQLYLAISLLWLWLIYLSVARDYFSLVIAFLAGLLLSFFLGSLGGIYLGLEGILGGFTLGQLFVVMALIYQLIRELPSPEKWIFRPLQPLLKYPRLIWIGLFYNLAIWIDKIIFWGAPGAIEISPLFRIHPHYDNASFIAFLTVIPTISLFVVRVETTFYRSYRNYFGEILSGASLKEIRRARKELWDKVKLSVWRLLKLQGTICFLVVVFAPFWVRLLGMAWVQITLLRFVAIGVSFHILFFLNLMFLLYFDWQDEVLWMTLSFALLNGVASYLTLYLDSRFYGLGYLFASFVHYIISWMVLFSHLENLEYFIFARQTKRKE